MNENSIQLYKSILSVALVTALLLMIPLLGVLFGGVDWSLSDFILAGILIFSTGTAYKLLTMKANNVFYRIATGLALFSGLFLIWSNLAVGIVGDYDDFNILYFGVIAVGIIGAILSHFQSDKLALTLFAMAFSQLLITVIAFMTGMHNSPNSSVYEILGANGFFITLFVVSALIYRYDSQEQSTNKTELEV